MEVVCVRYVVDGSSTATSLHLELLEPEIDPHHLSTALVTPESLKNTGSVGKQDARSPILTSKQSQKREKVVITVIVSVPQSDARSCNLRASSRAGSKPTLRAHRIQIILSNEATQALFSSISSPQDPIVDQLTMHPKRRHQ